MKEYRVTQKESWGHYGPTKRLDLCENVLRIRNERHPRNKWKIQQREIGEWEDVERREDEKDR